MSDTIGIVAVKSKSERFEDKNFQWYDGKPLYAHNTDLLLESEYIKKVYIFTDDERVNEYYDGNDKVKVIYRGQRISSGRQPLFKVWQWGALCIDEHFNYAVTIMANCVGHTVEDINKALLKAMDEKLWEVRSFNKDGDENGIIVFSEDVLKQFQISAYMGAIQSQGKEIHYESELEAQNLLHSGDGTESPGELKDSQTDG